MVTHIRHLVTGRLAYAVTSSTLLADPPSNETIDVFYIKIIELNLCVSNLPTNVCMFLPLEVCHPRCVVE